MIYTSVLEMQKRLFFLTDMPIYKNLDWQKISSIVKNPFWVFDTRSILDYKYLKEFNLNIWQLGNGLNQ